ncbi:hypothetical protein Ndes2526B_g05751 [Nannochloris sp. 'desiccata']|nr:hypothetical protein KSW81_007578 [Chlorella desiccata (nom. nud.)]KAH7618817.1 putative magnesium transporter NIPA3 [Chlorella desiccata (nom. nud.)]
MDASAGNQNFTGLVLAVSSSLFIGTSFIVKKKGLRRAGTSGVRAGSGGYSYLREPLWWAGLLTMVVGEAANFAAYAFAPAILVTPLGALSILVTAILAHLTLNEKLNVFGIIGCVLCVTGSLSIVLHAPEEAPITSVLHVWDLAMQPAFLMYVVAALGAIYVLIFRVPVDVQAGNILVYVSICSIVGSISVMSCKALGIALKLTLEGSNQFIFPQTYAFVAVVIFAVVTQMNYLNKALDIFNTAIVTPIYYVMFTTLTIAASMLMFKEKQTTNAIITELAGFVTIVCGTFLLHATKDLDIPVASLVGVVTGIRGRGVNDVEMSRPLVNVVTEQHGRGGAGGGGVGYRKAARQEDSSNGLGGSVAAGSSGIISNGR